EIIAACGVLTAARGGEFMAAPWGRMTTRSWPIFTRIHSKVVKLQEWIRVKIGDERVVTTPGRVVFNQPLPVGRKPMDEELMQPLPFQNAHFDRKLLRVLVAELYRLYGSDVTASVVNDIKRLGFRYATQA